MERKKGILEKIKEFWRNLGQPDVDVLPEETDEILKKAGIQGTKSPVVEKVNTNPVSMKDIIPEKELKNVEKER